MRKRNLALVVLLALLLLPACRAKRTGGLPPQAAQMKRILAGESTVNEVKAGGRTVKVGDRARVPWWEEVRALDDEGAATPHGVEAGGTLEVLGFTDDREEALVEYAPPKGAVSSAGARFFLPVVDFVTWGSRSGKASPDRAALQSEVKRIAAGVTPRTVKVKGAALKAGVRVKLPEPTEVEAVNTDEGIVGERRVAFRTEGPLDRVTLPAGLLVEVQGFSDDHKRALLQVVAPLGPPPPGALLVVGVQFFLPAERLAPWAGKK